MSNKQFLLSWDNTGLEGVYEIDLDRLNMAEQERTASVLTSPKSHDPGNPYGSEITNVIYHMKMRARFNPQRHYEIYLVPVTDGVGEEDIRSMFENSPQTAADLMRERGEKIYSDRVVHNRIVIT